MVTFSTLYVAQSMHFFEPKAIDGQTVVLFGLLNGTSIGLLNLSLGFNSIGFYQVGALVILFPSLRYDAKDTKIRHALQMTKLAIIPFTVLLETIFLKKRFR
jgi:solute carrier family 35 protein E3